MTVRAKALVALNIKKNRLVWAGRGEQPNADFPLGSEIGEVVIGSSGENYVQIKNERGTFFVSHADYIC